MARGTDGIMTGTLPYPRQANQDRTRYRLGESPARPAPGYFAVAAGLPSEQVIVDAIAGLTDQKEIEQTLRGLIGWQAYDYMKWRMGRT